MILKNGSFGPFPGQNLCLIRMGIGVFKIQPIRTKATSSPTSLHFTVPNTWENFAVDFNGEHTWAFRK